MAGTESGASVPSDTECCAALRREVQAVGESPFQPRTFWRTWE